MAARLGNFCCTEDGHGGSWLVTAEWDKTLPLFDRYCAHATFFVNGQLTDRLLTKMRTYQSCGHSVGLHSADHASAAETVAKTDAALAPYFDHLRTGHIFGRDPAKDPLAACDAAFISREKLASSRVLRGMGFGSKFPGIAEDLERGLEHLAARNEVLVLYSHDIMAKSDGGASICNNTSLDVRTA